MAHLFLLVAVRSSAQSSVPPMELEGEFGPQASFLNPAPSFSAQSLHLMTKLLPSPSWAAHLWLSDQLHIWGSLSQFLPYPCLPPKSGKIHLILLYVNIMFGATNNVTGCVNPSFESDEDCEDLEQIHALKMWCISGFCDISVCCLSPSHTSSPVLQEWNPHGWWCSSVGNPFLKTLE